MFPSKLHIGYPPLSWFSSTKTPSESWMILVSPASPFRINESPLLLGLQSIRVCSCGIFEVLNIFWTEGMEVLGKSVVAVHSNVVFLSSILGQDGPNPVHKCDWKCENENLFGNMYRCKLTGLTHVCDKNCNQRILYDNHSSLCRVSKQISPLTPVEQQAVRGVRRKLDAENSSTEYCSFKRRRDAQCHPSSFERPFTTVGPICSPIGDGMDTN